MINLLAVLYLGYELSETRKENRDLVQQLLQARQQEGSEEVKATSRGLSKTPLSSTLNLFRNAFYQ